MSGRYLKAIYENEWRVPGSYEHESRILASYEHESRILASYKHEWRIPGAISMSGGYLKL